MSTYVVTTSIQGKTRSQIWNSAAPLALGFPLQWIVEKTEKGVRVRNLATQLHQVQTTSLKEISEEILHSKDGVEVSLPPLSIKIRPTQSLAPAFVSRTGNTVNVFTCVGDTVITSETVESHFSGFANKELAFQLKKSGSSYELKAFKDGIQIHDADKAGKQGKSCNKGEALSMSADALSQSVLTLGGYCWRFNLVEAPAIPQLSANKRKALENDYDTLSNKLSMKYMAVTASIIFLLTWLWPKPKPAEELVPPQFTKIVMAQPQKTQPSAAPKGEMPAAAQNAPQKVQDAAVVQAFRAKALNNAVSGLLKGGMTRLLAQSDIVSGGKAAENARQMFNQKSDSLRANAPSNGLVSDKNVNVASVGGATGARVGYSKGEHAAVKGQGGAFVSMDIAGSSVEEGLSKDEVGEVIHRHLSEIRYCYESAMLRTPDIEGKLIVNFVIGGTGSVKSSEIKSSTLPDPRLDDCIIRRLVTWKFPQPKGGIDVAVSYPFIFKTLGR